MRKLITGNAPTPAELEWVRFVARTPHYVLSNGLGSAEWPNTRFVRNLSEADLGLALHRTEQLPDGRVSLTYAIND